MDFFKNIAGAVVGAKDILVEKNKKSALINRLRTVIKCEEQSCERAYMALGRYYYHNLRDFANPVTEPHCTDIEAAEKRLDAAIMHLEELYNEREESFTAEEITLDDVQEITPEEINPADQVSDGFVDEAVESVGSEIAADGENDNLPFE